MLKPQFKVLIVAIVLASIGLLAETLQNHVAGILCIGMATLFTGVSIGMEYKEPKPLWFNPKDPRVEKVKGEWCIIWDNKPIEKFGPGFMNMIRAILRTARLRQIYGR